MKLSSAAWWLLLPSLLLTCAQAAAAPSWSPAGPLRHRRNLHTATLLPDGKVLVTGGTDSTGSLTTAELYDPATGSWTPTGSLSQARRLHTATLLPDGKVLVAGGYSTQQPTLDTAELYDPATGAWSSTGSLAQARGQHTATLLPDGKVLVTGGYVRGTQSLLATAELYDPATGTWTPTGSLSQGHSQHTATLLPDGKVLVAGGDAAQPPTLASAEVYDPATGTWSPTSNSPLVRGRSQHTATLLPDGKVLVTGGYSRETHGLLATSELYDPATSTWSPTGSLEQPRSQHTATLLPDGKVLITGGHSTQSRILATAELYAASTGSDPSSGSWSPTRPLTQGRVRHTTLLLPGGRVLAIGGSDGILSLTSTELGDLSSGSWSPTGSLEHARYLHTATLLPEGKVLVTGGITRRDALAITELYDPATGSWSPIGALTQARAQHTATLLPDGKVLVVGGATGLSSFDVRCLATAELYDPDSHSWSPTGSLAQARCQHTATLLPEGKVLVTGGVIDRDTPATAELYDPATGSWSPTGSLAQARSSHTATLLPDGRVLVAGGNKPTTGTLTTAELHDPARGTWSSTGTLAQARSGHTAALLPDGQVLIAGLIGLSSPGYAERYESASGTWSLSSSLVAPTKWRTATLLPDGQVLIAGGSLDLEAVTSTELYEPVSGTWLSTAPLAQARYQHTATLLPDGRVLVVGGRIRGHIDDPSTLLATAELYTGFTVDRPRAPRLTGVSPSTLELGEAFTVSGHQLRGPFEEGFALLTLRALEGERVVSVPWRYQSSTHLSAAVPFLPHGAYLLSVSVQGLSDTRTVFLTNTTPPETTLKQSPPLRTANGTASFAFSSSSPDAHGFECSLDGSAFTPCASPQAYEVLEDGPHAFRVRAVDLARNVDPTSEEYAWTVDTLAPDTLLSTTPPELSNTPMATFVFSSDEARVYFECSLDNVAFTPCTMSNSFPQKDGKHTLLVRAVDSVGNVDPTPATYTWWVDTQPPQAPVIREPAQGQLLSSSRPTFTGTAEAGSTVVLYVEGLQVGMGQADDTETWLITPDVRLSWSTHRAVAQATDKAHNTSILSSELSFSIKQQGLYGVGCSATGGSWPLGSWVLLLWALRGRRRRSRLPTRYWPLLLLLPLAAQAERAGISLYESGEYEAALQSFTQVLSEPHRSAEERGQARMYMAASLHALGRMQEVRQQLELLAREHPQMRMDSARFLPELAALAEAIRQRVEAEQVYARREAELERRAREAFLRAPPVEPPPVPTYLRPEVLGLAEAVAKRGTLGAGLGYHRDNLELGARVLLVGPMAFHLQGGWLPGRTAARPWLGLRLSLLPSLNAYGGGVVVGGRYALPAGLVALAEVSAEYFPIVRNDSYLNVAITAQAGLGFDIRLL